MEVTKIDIVKILAFALCLLSATLRGQDVTDTCDYLEGGVIERQMQTRIDGLIRGTGYCVKPTIVNGGLELVGATLSVIDGDTVGQVLRWTGTDWETRLIIFPPSTGGVDTVYNGLTDRDTAFVLGGPLVEHTRVQGQKAYDITWDDMRTVYIEAQRTSGVAFSSVTMGSTAAAGVDFAHYNEANNAIQAVAAVNYSTGNVVKIQSSSSNGAYFQQYDNGGGLYQWDLTASDGSASKILRGNKNALYALYLDNLNISHEAAFVMVDTFTGELRRKSPADFTGLYGDNWGSQTVSTTARFSGNGTSGSPLELAQQSATTGQVMKWNGTSWAPGTDAGASAANLTAASSKVAITGGTGAVLNAATVDVNEANLTHNNIGGTLGISKGGTGLTSVGVNSSLLGSDGSAALWLTPTLTSVGVAASWSRSGSNLVLNIPDASGSIRGFMNTGIQTLGGTKTWIDRASFLSGLSASGSGTTAAITTTSATNAAAIDIVGVPDATYNVVTVNTTLTSSNNFIAIGTLSAGITLALPSCTSGRDGWEYRFLKTGSDAFSATIDPNGSETFSDGATTKDITGQFSSATCKCRWDGSAGTWFYAPVISPTSSILTASNALTASGSNVKFGGDLVENTAVDADGYTLDITNSDAITFSATGIFGTTSTLSVNSLLGEIAVENGSTKSLLGGNGSGSTYISHENTSTASTARIIAENYQKAALQYIPTGGSTSLEYFIDGGATVPGHYQKGMRYKSNGDTVVVSDATTGELRRKSITDPAYMPVFAFTGELKMIAVATTPTGWLTCDGSAVSRTTYADLFAVIGTTYGAGDGSTTFNLPDMRDRFPVGASGTKAIASTGGAETVTLSSGNLPSHTHTVSIPASTGGSFNDEPDNTKILGPASIYTSYLNADENLRSFNTGSAGSGTAVNIVPQYTAIRYIICWRGKTP